MSPFKLSTVKKQLGKLNLKREDSTYSLKPFILRLVQEHHPELTYTSKLPNLPFKEWKNKIHELIRKKVSMIEPLSLSEQSIEIYGEAIANDIKFVKLSLKILL